MNMLWKRVIRFLSGEKPPRTAAELAQDEYDHVTRVRDLWNK